MSLSPNVWKEEDQEAFSHCFCEPLWSQAIHKPPRFKAWKQKTLVGANWIKHRFFGTIGMCQTTDAGPFLYVATAVPIFVTAGKSLAIAWPRKRNIIRVAPGTTLHHITFTRPQLPIFKTTAEAWTFFAEHFCGTRVAVFELQHGNDSAFVPIAQLSSLEFAIRLQDRYASYADARKKLFDSFENIFLLVEPVILLDDLGRSVQDAKVDDSFWSVKKEYDKICPFEFKPSFFRWRKTYWKRSQFCIEITNPEINFENDLVSVKCFLNVPHELKLCKVYAGLHEKFYFSDKVKSGGVKKFYKTELKNVTDDRVEMTLAMSLRDYTLSFASLKSNPWAYIPLKLMFDSGHPDIFVVGVAAPRYLRGDLREATLHPGAPIRDKYYYKLIPSMVTREMTEIARYLDQEERFVSVVQAPTRLQSETAEGKRLLPGETFILLKYLTKLNAVFYRRQKKIEMPLYPRTSIIFEADEHKLAKLSKEAKIDKCGILSTPYWSSY